jgi:serine/threonine-protein kinase
MPRGPGYLRRWIAGETVTSRLARRGPYDVPEMLQILRAAGSALAYLHDTGIAHGALSPETVWVTPMGRIWLLGWQFALPRDEIPNGLAPMEVGWAPEWQSGWAPSAKSDQWQLAALCFAALTGELPPSRDTPPIRLLRPDCPEIVARLLDQALLPDPAARYPSVTGLLRAVDRGSGIRTVFATGIGDEGDVQEMHSDESRLRWAAGEDYEVLAALGSGTFGSVWRVRDLTLGREVALKMLHPHIARDASAVARFRREARLAAQLAHPAIVPIYDWDSRGDVSWYTMELCEGGSLADLIQRAGPRPLDEVASQVWQILGGLEAAHASGIVHRDLKPENILIDRYRRARISDFGIANVAGEEAGGTTGTPAFAAPEQLLGEPQGPPVDCFALAAIVIFSLTGQLPFGTGDAKAILARQLGERLQVPAGVPALAAWLRRALSAAPEHRFADAGAMLTEWRRTVAPALRVVHLPWWRRWLA